MSAAVPQSDDSNMAPALDALQRALIDGYQHGFPMTPRPYAAIAEAEGVTEEAVLEALAGAVSGLEARTGLACIGRIFAGARERADALAGHYPDNVLFTGRVPYEELPAYLSHAIVGIAPFVLDERTRAINPNKLYMYAAMEQNIVSTPFSDDITENGDLIFIADGADAFADAVIEALGDDERRRAVRERIAVPNSWDERARAFQDILVRTTSGGHREA